MKKLALIIIPIIITGCVHSAANRKDICNYLKQKISGGGNLYTREMQLISQYKELNCNQINAGVVER